jgi:hypothetical protein
MRLLLAVSLLTGCDVVLGLDERPPPVPGESTKNDEDADGIVDAIDLCPQLGQNSLEDTDKDHIGDDCDPRPNEPDERFFFAFLGGDIGRLTTTGVLMSGDIAEDPDSVILGAIPDPHSALVLDVDSPIADIVVDATIRQVKGSLASGEYSELGVHSVLRAFTADKSMRGDICVLGRDNGSPQNYLELHEDNIFVPRTVRFPGPLENQRGTIMHHRTADILTCVFESDAGLRYGSPEVPRTVPRNLVGDVAITTEHLTLQIHSLWIVVPATRP